MKVTVTFSNWLKTKESSANLWSLTLQIHEVTAELKDDKNNLLANIPCYLEGVSEFRVKGNLPEGITEDNIRQAYFSRDKNSPYVIEIDDVVDAAVVAVVDDAAAVDAVDADDDAVELSHDEVLKRFEQAVENHLESMEKLEKCIKGSAKGSDNTLAQAKQLNRSLDELKKQYNIDMHLSSFSLGMGIGLICSLIGAVVLALCSTEVGIALIAAGVLAVLVGCLMKNQEDTTHHKTPAPSM